MQVQVLRSEGEEKSTRYELSGNAGSVMQESAKCAMAVAKARFGKDLLGSSFHINFTNTAQPKDGPSAGLAIYLALHSAITSKPLPSNLACTGEVDILGNIYKIGGLKEKLYGGYRAGARRFLIPKANEDAVIEEFRKSCEEEVQVVLVGCVEEAVKIAWNLGGK